MWRNDDPSNAELGDPGSEKHSGQVGLVSSIQAAKTSNFSKRTLTGVSVESAEANFAELNREFSNISHQEHGLPKDINILGKDIEKAIGDSQAETEPFDLEQSLRGNRDGIRSKRIGVVWDALTVTGLGGVKHIVKTFPSAFVSFFNVPETVMHMIGYGKKGSEFDILRNLRGVAKPGEMVLVLGRPGSGCTTFLKVISNQRFGYTNVAGEILYGSFDSEVFGKKYRGEAVYNQEDDIHYETLTVGQTLGFALDTKMPGKRPRGMSQKDFKSKVVHMLLKMFNIEHTQNTVVGGPFIRGISGGERKRVSIAEMMITSATVCAWDNTTRGLDSSTALDYAKSLRVMTNIYETTTFVSLYQASENIYKQFDKVMVIDRGRQVFFGPIGDARGYFEGLGFKKRPRQTTPDYLTGCTDPFEREYKDGVSEASAPSDPDSLAKAFEESIFADRLTEEMVKYRKQVQAEKETYEEFHVAYKESKRKHTPNSSVYGSPFYLQIWSLMKRQFLIKWQNSFSLKVSWFTSLVIAVVLGTVWLNTPTTSRGAFTRGGVLFVSLLFNAFQAFGELGTVLLGRGIVNKHRAYTFYRPSALWIAQLLVDSAFSAVQIFVFSVMVYFMTGLAREAAAFFSYWLAIFTTYLAMTLFFRSVACLCPDFDYALKFAVVIISLFVSTAGYLIQYNSEQVWLRWMLYINALGLGFSSLMVNEFKRITFTCDSQYLVPNGPGYGDLAHQVCTLAGGTPGSDLIPGRNYIADTFQYYVADQWRNYGLILVLIAVYLTINVTVGEILTVKFGSAGKTITFYAKENKKMEQLNADLQKRKDNRLAKDENRSSELDIQSKAVLTWENLTYDVPVKSGQKRLLKDVYGFVKPGQLTALMGASGAGKTTLLDVLAARKNIGVIGGNILIDGVRPGTAFQRGTSYAEQLDVHEGTQTVREALRFSADLRQPYEISQEDKYAYVEEVIALLEMEDIADAIIGDTTSGLAVEQRKRVTIGVELAAKPELLLFLDEPTSGLDSQSAFNIIRFLKKLAAAGQAILCTIHQPGAALFENFDRLLLLQRRGETIYFGEIGKDASTLLEYFRRNGAVCPPDANIAEWMLDAIGAGNTPQIGDKDWGEIWNESPELVATKEQITEIKRQRIKENGGALKMDEKEYATPLWHQIKMVNRRTHLAFWRSPNYGFTRLFNHVSFALISGFTFFHLGDNKTSLQYRVFVTWQTTVLPALILAQVEPKYDLSRLIFYREAAAKTYSQFAFVFSMVTAEMPYSVICAIGFFLPIHYLPGLQSAPDRAGYAFLMILITELFSVTLGQMIAALTPSSFISALLNPFVIITFALFCGVAIPPPQIPTFWRSWLYQLDPFTRLVGGMASDMTLMLPRAWLTIHRSPQKYTTFQSSVSLPSSNRLPPRQVRHAANTWHHFSQTAVLVILRLMRLVFVSTALTKLEINSPSHWDWSLAIDGGIWAS
ncbi:MAG: hypothetical protein MMC33_009334 [Icmadophila ericetorum]|nr:hypothetical protein [Icmadophila ericetorum]